MTTTVFLDGEPLELTSELLSIGQPAPDFQLVFSRNKPQASENLSSIVMPQVRRVGLQDFAKRPKLINVFPSIDTPVCAKSVHVFEQHARENPEDALLMVSADLPFAMQRFCADNSVKNVFPLSMVENRRFAHNYGVLIGDGPWAGICARACFVVDRADVIQHVQLSPHIEDELNFKAALEALNAVR